MSDVAYRALGVDPPIDHRPRKRSACCGESLDEHGYCQACTVSVQQIADEQALHHAAADQAHRDDLARDAAKMWAAVPSWGRTRLALRESNPALAAALDRLAAVYGTGRADVNTDYECGRCGSRDLVISAVVDGWEITCGRGHVLVPVPGTVYSTNSGQGG